MSQDDLRAQRVDFVRSLSQGVGVTEQVLISRLDERERFFGVKARDLEYFTGLLDVAAESMGDGAYQAAILNALKPQDGEPNLTERRTRYLAEDGGISYRTLIKYEQEGAELLVKYMEVWMEKEAHGEDDATADTMDLEVMRRRLLAIERKANSFNEDEWKPLVEELSARIDYLEQRISDVEYMTAVNYNTTATLTKVLVDRHVIEESDLSEPFNAHMTEHEKLVDVWHRIGKRLRQLPAIVQPSRD